MKVSHESGGPTTGTPGVTSQSLRLLDQVRARMRRLGLASRTEEAYVVRGQVAASTQNQALAALLFLYREMLGVELPRMTHPVRLMDEVRSCLRLKHYSLRTEQAYIGWIRRFIAANGKQHPRELGASEVARAMKRARGVESTFSCYAATSTYSTALLGSGIGWLSSFIPSR